VRLQLGISLPEGGPTRTLGTVSHASNGKLRVSKESGNFTFTRSGGLGEVGLLHAIHTQCLAPLSRNYSCHLPTC